MARPFLLILSLLAIAIVVAPGRTAMADSAPVRSAGPGFQPVYSSKVRMEGERIDIFLHRRDENGAFARAIAADVTVHFHFVPTADESMDAGFPLQAPLKQQSNYRLAAENFGVTVQGTTLPFERRQVTLDGETSEWAIWHLDFKQGKPLDLEVRYRMAAGGSYKHADAPLGLAYVLQTGRFWDGSIGQADVLLRAERPLKATDLMVGTTPGHAFKDGQFRWQWRDLEPAFDLQVLLQNPWWLDLPADLAVLLEKRPFGREHVLQAAAGLFSLYEGSDWYAWAPVRDGRLSGQAANALMPQVLKNLDPLLTENPGDWELRQLQIRLLSAGESTRDGGRDPDVRQRYEAAVQTYLRDGGPAFQDASGARIEQPPPKTTIQPPASAPEAPVVQGAEPPAAVPPDAAPKRPPRSLIAGVGGSLLVAALVGWRRGWK